MALKENCFKIHIYSSKVLKKVYLKIRVYGSASPLEKLFENPRFVALKVLQRNYLKMDENLKKIHD